MEANMVIDTANFGTRFWDASGSFILCEEASSLHLMPYGGNFFLRSEVTGSQIGMVPLEPIRDPEGELAAWCWGGVLPDGRGVEVRVFND